MENAKAKTIPAVIIHAVSVPRRGQVTQGPVDLDPKVFEQFSKPAPANTPGGPLGYTYAAYAHNRDSDLLQGKDTSAAGDLMAWDVLQLGRAGFTQKGSLQSAHIKAEVFGAMSPGGKVALEKIAPALKMKIDKPKPGEVSAAKKAAGKSKARGFLQSVGHDPKVVAELLAELGVELPGAAPRTQAPRKP